MHVYSRAPEHTPQYHCGPSQNHHLILRQVLWLQERCPLAFFMACPLASFMACPLAYSLACSQACSQSHNLHEFGVFTGR